jgi:hypothetical protein
VQSPKLQPGEQAFVLMSLVPNRKGQPLLVEWQVATGVLAPRAGAFSWSPLTVLPNVQACKPASCPTVATAELALAARKCDANGIAACGSHHARLHAEAQAISRPVWKSACKARWI